MSIVRLWTLNQKIGKDGKSSCEYKYLRREDKLQLITNFEKLTYHKITRSQEQQYVN